VAASPACVSKAASTRIGPARSCNAQRPTAATLTATLRAVALEAAPLKGIRRLSLFYPRLCPSSCVPVCQCVSRFAWREGKNDSQRNRRGPSGA
jgi:hypothetical protein